MAFLLFASSVTAGEQVPLQTIQILDNNNETVIGAKIELVGTNYTYYTNLKGEVYIPSNLLKGSKGINVECISYKTKNLKNYEVNSKIILEFR